MTAPTQQSAVTLSIDDMSCGHCVQAVTKALSAVAGVNVRSVGIGTAQIEAADPTATNRAIAALEGAGYPARTEPGASSATKPGAGASGGCCR